LIRDNLAAPFAAHPPRHPPQRRRQTSRWVKPHRPGPGRNRSTKENSK
jgi:hypothetical protein